MSNVESPNKECITLTYSIKDVGSITKARELAYDLDQLHGEPSFCDLDIKNVFGKDASVNLSYKLKACEGEAEARTIKMKLDKFLRKKGGQTTLDEA